MKINKDIDKNIVFQSSKVENAEKFGAKGLLLYDEQPFEDSVSRDLYEVEHSKTLARNIILNVRPKVWTNQNVGMKILKHNIFYINLPKF